MKPVTATGICNDQANMFSGIRSATKKRTGETKMDNTKIVIGYRKETERSDNDFYATDPIAITSLIEGG